MKIPITPTAPLTAQLRPWGLDYRGGLYGYLVYRFYDRENGLLYVGSTASPSVRFQHHKNYAPWWNESSFLMVERHDDRAAAHRAEVRAIDSENPSKNRNRKIRVFQERVGSESGASRESVTTDLLADPESVGPYARVGARASRRVRDRRQERCSGGASIHTYSLVPISPPCRTRCMDALASLALGGGC